MRKNRIKKSKSRVGKVGKVKLEKIRDVLEQFEGVVLKKIKKRGAVLEDVRKNCIRINKEGCIKRDKKESH